MGDRQNRTETLRRFITRPWPVSASTYYIGGAIATVAGFLIGLGVGLML